MTALIGRATAYKDAGARYPGRLGSAIASRFCDEVVVSIDAANKNVNGTSVPTR